MRFLTCVARVTCLVYYNSPKMRKKLIANCGSQFLLNRLGTCHKLFVWNVCTSYHEFASQFGLKCFYAGNRHTKLSQKLYAMERRTNVFGGHGRLIASDSMHERRQRRPCCVRLRQYGEMQQVKRQQRDIIRPRLDKCALGIIM